MTYSFLNLIRLCSSLRRKLRIDRLFRQPFRTISDFDHLLYVRLFIHKTRRNEITSQLHSGFNCLAETYRVLEINQCACMEREEARFAAGGRPVD